MQKVGPEAPYVPIPTVAKFLRQIALECSFRQVQCVTTALSLGTLKRNSSSLSAGTRMASGNFTSDSAHACALRVSMITKSSPDSLSWSDVEPFNQDVGAFLQLVILQLYLRFHCCGAGAFSRSARRVLVNQPRNDSQCIDNDGGQYFLHVATLLATYSRSRASVKCLRLD